MLTTQGAKIVLPMLLASALPAIASAQTAQSTPYLQDASVTGFGNTITINRLPISVSSGGFVFKDVTVTLTTTDGQGTLNSTAAVTQAPSVPPTTSNIVAGSYYLNNSSYNHFVVSGPSPIGKGGEAEWTITPTESGNYAYPCGSPGEFYTGPLNGNPFYARLKAAKITNTEYQYGVVDSGTGCASPFATGSIIGVSQVGNTLSVTSFTSNGKDQSTPVTSYIYTLIQ